VKPGPKSTTEDVLGLDVPFVDFGPGSEPRWHAQLDTPELGEESCWVFNGTSFDDVRRAVEERILAIRGSAVREVMES